jgi:hypothetical protein
MNQWSRPTRQHLRGGSIRRKIRAYCAAVIGMQGLGLTPVESPLQDRKPLGILHLPKRRCQMHGGADDPAPTVLPPVNEPICVLEPSVIHAQEPDFSRPHRGFGRRPAWVPGIWQLGHVHLGADRKSLRTGPCPMGPEEHLHGLAWRGSSCRCR